MEKFLLSDDELRQISLYRNTLSRGYGYGDYNEWPVKLNAAFHLFLKEFGDEYLEDLKYLEEEKGYTKKQISELFYNPSRIFRIIDYIIYSLRKSHTPLIEQRKVVLKLLAIFKELKYGSMFNEDGANIIYNPEKVQEIFKNLKTQDIDKSISKKIHSFCGIMWAYCECLFFRAHDVPKEIHGPYESQDKETKFVVQEYLNLRPTELWSNVTLLPCNTIKIYKKYKKTLKLGIDPLNHIYHEGGDFINDLCGFYIEVDGKEESIETLTEFLEIIEKTIIEINERLSAMKYQEIVLKYAEIYWFRKKPLRDARGISWKVSETLRERILAGKENPVRKPKLSEEDSRRMAMITI